MDELKNCSICGKVYQSNEFTNVCTNCVEHEENEFEIIREYLYTHPLASIYEVATNLDLTINKIKHFLRDGRIEVVEKNNQFLSCKTCGKPIHSGWYCEDCLRQAKLDIKPGPAGTVGPNGGVYPGSNYVPSKAEEKIKFLSKNKK
jgi:hypothetical protein